MSEGEVAAAGDHATAEPQGDQAPLVKPRPRCAALGVKRIYTFLPQPGITADEVAESVELLVYGIVTMTRGRGREQADALYGGMSEGGRRHWSVKEISGMPQIAVPRAPGAGGRPGLKLPPGAK